MMTSELLDNLRPLAPILQSAKRMIFDKPPQQSGTATEDMKRERDSFIENNPRPYNSDLLAIEYHQKENELEQTHIMYKSIISMYQKQAIEMAKLLDKLQHQLYKIQVDVHKKYEQNK